MTYTVKKSDPESDRDRVVDLWSQNLPGSSPGRYAWLYETGTAVGWLIQAPDAEDVGSAGLMERRFQAFGDNVRAGQTIDLNVTRAHRTVGPALSLQRAAVATVKAGRFDWIYAVSNPNAEDVFDSVS